MFTSIHGSKTLNKDAIPSICFNEPDTIICENFVEEHDITIFGQSNLELLQSSSKLSHSSITELEQSDGSYEKRLAISSNNSPVMSNVVTDTPKKHFLIRLDFNVLLFKHVIS